MYEHRTIIVEQWVVALSDDGLPFDVLTAVVEAAKDKAEAEGLSLETDVQWKIRGWPDADRDPEHLVINATKAIARKSRR